MAIASGLLKLGSRGSGGTGYYRPQTTGFAAGQTVPAITTSNGVPDTASVNNAAITANQQNSQYNNALTHGSTTTPLGSQTYTSHRDPVTGAIVYDTNVTLAPDQQKLLDLQNKQSLALGQTGTGLLGKIGQSYGSDVPTNPYSWDDFQNERSRVENSLYKQNTQYLDPQFAQKKEALSQQLASQGIVSGSDAWRQAMDQYARESQQAYGDARQSAISGSGTEATLFGNAGHQQLMDALTSRNEPLNEYNAIRSASPVNIPQFNPAQTPLAQNVDVAGNAFHSADENIQQQAIKAGNRNAVTSGLFGLGAEFLGSKAGGDLISGGLSKLGGLFGMGGGGAAGTAGAAAGGAGAAGAAGASTFLPSTGIPFSGPAALADTGAWPISSLGGAGAAGGGAGAAGAAGLTEFGAGDLSALGGSGAAGSAGAAGGIGTAGAIGLGAAAIGAGIAVDKIGNHYNWWGNNNPSRIGESHVPKGAIQWAAPNGDNIIGAKSPSGSTMAMQVNHGKAPGDPVLYPPGGDPVKGTGGWELKGFRKGEDTTLTNQATGQQIKITDAALQQIFGMTAAQFGNMYGLITSSYTQ